MADFLVQIATPHGIANEAELFRRAYGHDLGSDAHAQLDAISADVPVYGWRTVAQVDDEDLAHRMVALAESGFRTSPLSSLFARAVKTSEVTPDELRQALLQLEMPEAGYGEVLREEAEKA